MSSHLEGYGFISDMHGSALVSNDGTIDWLCMPRFDSDACMAALLGRDQHGCWMLHPAAAVRGVERRYRPGTMILETDFACDGGAVRFIDFMAARPFPPSVIRIVEGLEGSVQLDSILAARFGYGRSNPWISAADGATLLTVAPDSLLLRTPIPVVHAEHNVQASFAVGAGERVPFVLSWQAAHRSVPPPVDAFAALAETERQWRGWSGRSQYRGPYRDVVDRSLITLKGMIYAPTGGIVAAPTAGLPESLGGVRNWDYRYCWLRDATLTLEALMSGGYTEEGRAWRDWLLRAVAGAPEDLQIMYGVEGERRLTEFEVPWLPGYEDSHPVRIGNAASEQFQLDVYGEMAQTLYEARKLGFTQEPASYGLMSEIIRSVANSWQLPDDGIWEVRGGRRHFVHSKVAAWVAVDRWIRYHTEFAGEDTEFLPLLPSLRALRDRMHRDICEHGFNTKRNTFTQAYNSEALDATLLVIPGLGFLPASDPRVQGTIRAVEKELMQDGFVLRYRTDETQDGLAGDEGAFLACSFILVEAYALSGRRREAEELFERLIALRNDLGLLSEEYDTKHERLVGNFPQALSHLALIHAANVLGSAS